MFDTVFSSVLWFIVAIGVLVTVHEFGHYWVARRLGVKVLRFSVGFGRPLWTWRGTEDRIEYCIAAIPLGGYVKMLDEREEHVLPSEQHRAFNRQRLGVRFAIVAAGPAANFAFAILAYWLMFMAGVSGFKPLVGEVEPGSRADNAGLVTNQQIVRVGDRDVQTWQGFVERMLGATLQGGTVTLEVTEPNAFARQLELDLHGLALDDLTQGQLFEQLGVQPLRPTIPPVLDNITEGAAADSAGLRSGDEIKRVDSVDVRGWQHFVDIIRSNPQRDLLVTVLRNGTEVQLTVMPKSTVGDSGEEIGRIGASVAVAEVDYGPYEALERYPPGESLAKALLKTWDMTALTLKMLGKMLTLEVSVKNLSGPISIAQYAGLSAKVGLARFLDFLAIVSISLGILNVLPIPLLDGGHLMYYCIELVRGRPVSEDAQFVGQRLGIAMLVGLMGLAFYNDLARVFG